MEESGGNHTERRTAGNRRKGSKEGREMMEESELNPQV